MQAPRLQAHVPGLISDQKNCLPPLRLPLLAGSLQSCMDGGAARNTECSVCYDDFDSTSHIIVHPDCRNGFHVACMDVWINHLSQEAKENITCPICRGIYPLDNTEIGVAGAYWKAISGLAEDMHSWAHVSHMKNWFLSMDLYHGLTLEMQDVEEWGEWATMLQADQSEYAITSIREGVDDFTTEVRRLMFQRIFYNRARILRTTVARALTFAEAEIFQGRSVAAVRQSFRQAFSVYVGGLIATATFPPEDLAAHRLKIKNRFQRIRQACFLAAPDDPSETSLDAVTTAFYRIMQASIPGIIEEYDSIFSFYLTKWVLNNQDVDLRLILKGLLVDFENVALVTKYSGRVAMWSANDLLKQNAS